MPATIHPIRPRTPDPAISGLRAPGWLAAQSVAEHLLARNVPPSEIPALCAGLPAEVGMSIAGAMAVLEAQQQPCPA